MTKRVFIFHQEPNHLVQTDVFCQEAIRYIIRDGRKMPFEDGQRLVEGEDFRIVDDMVIPTYTIRHKTHRELGYIYMDCHISMGEKKMASVLYAMIMCRAQITNSFGVGIYEYTRSQNSRNGVDLKIFIDPEKVSLFEELSGIKLKTPPVISGQ